MVPTLARDLAPFNVTPLGFLDFETIVLPALVPELWYSDLVIVDAWRVSRQSHSACRVITLYSGQTPYASRHSRECRVAHGTRESGRLGLTYFIVQSVHAASSASP